MFRKNMTQSVSSFEETAKELDIKRHILHLWVKKFPILQPKKSATGVLGFEPRDISFARGLKVLLIDEGKTIQEAQKMLNERGVSYVAAYGREKAALTYKKSLNMGQGTASQNSINRSGSASISEQLQKIFPAQQDKGGEIKTISAASAGLIHKTTDSHVYKKNDKNFEEIIMQNTAKASLDDAGTSHFEDKWRDFMHDKGKIASKDEIIAKRHKSTEYDDIAFIDDDDNIEDFIKVNLSLGKETIAFEDYGAIAQDNTPKEMRSASNNDAIADDNIDFKQKKPRLSVKNQEKMQHLLAKLDILKTELTVTRDVMTSTLKAFGYSGFGDAYSRHDNKSVY